MSNSHILWCDMTNPLMAYIFKLKFHTKGKLAENHHLVSRINTINIICRVAFRKAKTLCFGKGIFVRPALLYGAVHADIFGVH